MGHARVIAAFILLAVRAEGGPTGPADSHAARATGFPGAYLETVSLSLAADPLYGSRLLDGVEMHLRSVSAMTAPSAVSDYLESSVMGALGGGREASGRLAAKLGREPMDTVKASALLVANALARPDQFREVLDGLETVKPGLGKYAAQLLREAKGAGDKRLIETLRAAGALEPRGKMLAYGPNGRLGRVFDGERGYPAAPTVVVVPDSYRDAGRAAPARLD